MSDIINGFAKKHGISNEDIVVFSNKVEKADPAEGYAPILLTLERKLIGIGGSNKVGTIKLSNPTSGSSNKRVKKPERALDNDQTSAFLTLPDSKTNWWRADFEDGPKTVCKI
jgi:hypothetical protein